MHVALCDMWGCWGPDPQGPGPDDGADRWRADIQVSVSIVAGHGTQTDVDVFVLLECFSVPLHALKIMTRNINQNQTALGGS